MGCCFSKKVSPEFQPEQIIVDKTKLKEIEEIDRSKFEKDSNKKRKEITPKFQPEQIIVDKTKSKKLKKEIEEIDRSKFEKDLKKEEKEKLDERSEINEWIKLIEILSEKRHLESYVFSKKKSDFLNVKEVADFINNGPGKSDLEKFWMIFLWITENISYNRIGYNSGNLGENDADSVFRTGLAVCEGFSNLFSEISKFIGLECARISGYAKGFGYNIGDTFESTNHAWNVITVEDKKYYVDSTWSGRRNNLEKTIKEWNPYWFMTPPKIFLESHLSPEIILHPDCSLKDFEKMHYFELLYHIYGFKCDQLDGSFIRATSNPSILELTSIEDCELLVSLKDYETDTKIDDAVVIQKDSAQNPFKYCLIIDTSSNKKKKYLNIFAKKKNSQSTEFSFLTKLILIPSDKQIHVNQLEKLIPAYNLTFLENKLRLISHGRKIIPLAFDKLVMEFEIESSLEPSFDLKSFNTKEIIKDSIIVQCENAPNRPNINKYCLIISFENVDKKFILNVFARNLKTNQANYSFVTDFIMVLDEKNPKLNYKDFEKLIPAYNLTFLENKLRLISHGRKIIPLAFDKLVMEFEIESSLEPSFDLKSFNTKEIIKDSIIVQCENAPNRPNINKYCLIISFENVDKKFILNVFARNLKTNQANYSFVTDFIMVLDEKNPKLNYKDFEKLIPAYNLTFLENKLRLISHKKMFIINNGEVLSLEFDADESVELMAKLKESGSSVVLDNTTLIQKNPTNSHILVNLIFPSVNKLYNLVLLSKKPDNFFYEFAKFKLYNTGLSNNNLFITCYQIKHKYYVYEPINKTLKVNTKYRFKYYFENAKVVFFRLGTKEIFLKKSNIQPDIFEIEFEPDRIGELKLCLKYEYTNSYSYLCDYLVE